MNELEQIEVRLKKIRNEEAHLRARRCVLRPFKRPLPAWMRPGQTGEIRANVPLRGRQVGEVFSVPGQMPLAEAVRLYGRGEAELGNSAGEA